jgi:hypothetical protein
MRSLKAKGGRTTEPNVESTLSRIRRWAKGLAGFPSASKTEITVETDSVLILRRQRVSRGWCAGCERDVDLVSLEDAEEIARTSSQKLPIACAASLHFCDGPSDAPLLCLDSLLKWL